MHRHSGLLVFQWGLLTWPIYSQTLTDTHEQMRERITLEHWNWFTGHLPCDILVCSARHRIPNKLLTHTCNMSTHNQDYSTWQTWKGYFTFNLIILDMWGTCLNTHRTAVLTRCAFSYCSHVVLCGITFTFGTDKSVKMCLRICSVGESSKVRTVAYRMYVGFRSTRICHM